MTTLTVDIPDELLSRLECTGRPAQDVIVEALEQALPAGPASPAEEPSKEEIIRQLVEAGLVREPGSWDSPAARVWRELPEEEKQRHIREMNEMWFPDSPASRFIMENRR